MMKRLFPLLLVICMAFGTSTAVVAEYTDTQKNIYEDAAALLGVLGIIEGYTDGTYEVNEPMTRVEFAEIAVKLARIENLKSDETYFYDVKKSSPHKNAINLAYSNGYILTEGKYFYPEKAIKTEDVARVLVMLLGYESTTDNFTLKANQLGLFKNVYFADGNITRGGIITAVFNTLKTDKLLPSAIAEENGSYSYADMTISGTLLEENFDIYESEGQFTAVNDLDLFRTENELEDSVRIDDVRYRLSDGMVIDSSMFAKHVSFYYRLENKNDIPELVWYTDEYMNDVYYASAENIDHSDCTITKFVYDDGKKTRTLKISASAKFIVNGHIIDDSKKTPLLYDINAGYAMYVKPQDSEIPVLWIWDYDYYNVKSCGVREIYLADGNKIDIYDENNENFEVVCYNSSGSPASTDDILNNSAIAVADSLAANGKLYRNIYILQSVSGTLMGFSDDSIIIDETEYKKHHKLQEAKNGFAYTFFVGMSGEICLVDPGSEKSLLNGYLLAVKLKKEGVENTMMFKILNSSGLQETFNITDKVYINDVAVKIGDFAVNSQATEDVLDSSTGMAIRQPIKYITDGSGILKRIYTAKEDGKLELDMEAKSRLCKASNLFSFDALFTVSSEGVIFAVPDDVQSADNDDFGVLVKGDFYNDTRYVVAGYNVNEFGEADILIVVFDNLDEPSYNERNTYTCLFDKKAMCLNRDGDETWKITYWQQGSKKTTELAVRAGEASYESTLKEIENLECGDAFKIELTAERLIKNLEIEFKESERTSSTENFNAGRLMYYGQVEAVSVNSIFIRRFSADGDGYLDASSKILFPAASRVNTYLYSGEDYPIELLSNCIEDVKAGDWVLMQSRYLAPRTLIVYRDDSKLPDGSLR